MTAAVAHEDSDSALRSKCCNLDHAVMKVMFS